MVSEGLKLIDQSIVNSNEDAKSDELRMNMIETLKNIKKEDIQSMANSIDNRKNTAEMQDMTEELKTDSTYDNVYTSIIEESKTDSTYDNVYTSIIELPIDQHKKSIKGKVIKPQHGAFNDGSGLEKYWPLVMYEIGDEYIPISNSCVGEIGKIDPNKNPDPTFDMFGAYSNGDRFTVVRPTYSEDIKYDRKKIKCWFVNVRSQKTGKIYRALSE